MKVAVLTGLCLLLGCALRSSLAESGRFRMVLEVRDDAGEPVRDARVFGRAWDPYRPATPRSDGTYRYGFDELSDKNGQVVISGIAYSDMNIMIHKDGYYRSRSKFQFVENPMLILDGARWLPWGFTNNVVLKRIRNPVPMHVRHIREIKPTDGEYWGYDMLVGDWTQPLGEGETRDIEIRYDLEVLTTNRVGAAREFDAAISFRFPGSGNGIQQVLQDTTSGSSYRMLYEAPLNGYVSQVAFRRTILLGRLQTNANRDQCHYFRVRTKKDAGGNILHALYGKMPGDLTEAWLYYLNPDGTRNVEFDPDRNLFPPVRRYEGKFGP